jgi:hypothetical protein
VPLLDSRSAIAGRGRRLTRRRWSRLSPNPGRSRPGSDAPISRAQLDGGSLTAFWPPGPIIHATSPTSRSFKTIVRYSDLASLWLSRSVQVAIAAAVSTGRLAPTNVSRGHRPRPVSGAAFNTPSR